MHARSVGISITGCKSDSSCKEAAAEQTMRRGVHVPVDGAAGRRCWAIAEGYIPGRSVDPFDPELESHEACCILNASVEDARIEITIFFENRAPVGPYRLTVPAKRTKHLRFNDLNDPEPIPRDTSYSSVVVSNVPIIVQHTRLDSRNPNIALLSTVAFPAD